MGRRVCQGLIVIAALMATSAAIAAQRKPPPPPPPPPVVSDAARAALAGSWNGNWTADQYRYDAILTLDLDADGNVGGTINWTLRSTPTSKGRDKVGARAIEFVRGKYYAEPETLVLEGYRKDDPNDIWELDKYRLTIAPTRETMAGLTEEHGAWNGMLFLQRSPR